MLDKMLVLLKTKIKQNKNKKGDTTMRDAIFSQLDFGPLTEFITDDNITDVSYSNGGQVWLKTLDKGFIK